MIGTFIGPSGCFQLEFEGEAPEQVRFHAAKDSFQAVTRGWPPHPTQVVTYDRTEFVDRRGRSYYVYFNHEDSPKVTVST